MLWNEELKRHVIDKSKKKNIIIIIVKISFFLNIYCSITTFKLYVKEILK